MYSVQRMGQKWPHGGVSISTVVGWINEVCYIPVEWALYPCKSDNNRAVELTQISVYLTTDVPRTRAYSVNNTNTPHDTNFVTRVRSRDSRCCIGGHLVAGEDYTGFEAAHIFPLSETDLWNDLNYKRFIEDDQIAPGFELNSIQQGFLCSSAEHRMFDNYSIGVNPDDNFCIYDFVGRDHNRSHTGKHSIETLTSTNCVLRHVKGAGESNEPQRRFDPDIDLHASGFNLTIGSWWSGPEGKRQLEAELAGRL
ncbi:hypothetical protein BJV77DRAFT_959827 [Russula vinacea]|nr:hypothetical protein BJV77DRAFT_959827 [Russula vinacea]